MTVNGRNKLKEIILMSVCKVHYALNVGDARVGDVS